MRPTRLELRGFSAFAEPTELDLADVSLFALTGPTGAGKTSLIDAIVFALYGLVPRYRDARLVEPVISQDRQEAHIRLDFTVGDAAYTVVRVVRRTKTGATTKEARLERGTEVLAGDVKALDAAVHDLIGLNAEQFTTCVVLPQGEFAKFLHSKPSDRQEILIRLLDLGRYERIGARARERAKLARAAVVRADARLAELVDVTDESRQAADARRAALDELVGAIEKQQPRLAELAAAVVAARETERSAMSAAAVLVAVSVPGGVAELAARVMAADEAVTRTSAALVTSGELLAAAEAARTALPERASLEAAIERHGQRRDAEARRLAASAAVDAATAAVAAATTEVDAATNHHQAAVAEVEALRDAHRAQHLRGQLAEGDPCPVCERVVTAVPALSALSALDDAIARAKTTVATLAAATSAGTKAAEAAASARAVLAAVGEESGRLDAQLAQAPDEATATKLLAEITTAEQTVDAARTADQRARAEDGAARRAQSEAQAAVTGALQRFDAVRDGLAAYAPPPTPRDDLARAWRELAGWAATEATTRRETATAASAAAAAADTEHAAITSDLHTASRDAGVEPAEPLRDRAVDARSRAERDVERIGTGLVEKAALITERAEAEAAAAVADALGKHLRSDGFERWLLRQAIERLIAFASERLRDLSHGQYSFALTDELDYLVVDHHAADLTRSTKSLSGGETFLASLALALTLADQVVELAARGAAALESVFLDEGFGTLDPDALDTVATAIEELASRGRMVGIVTHVRELAERMPVRFEVSKGAAGATIARVDA